MFKNSVDKITRSLSKMVEQLEAHASHQDAQATAHYEHVARHEDHARVATREAKRAREVASKIKGLTS